MTVLILASSNPLDHVVSHKLFWMIDNHIVMQLVATFFVLMLFTSAFKSLRRAGEDDIESMVPKGLGNLFEVICGYLRDQVAKPVLGHFTDRFIPYIWSVFFFVLFINLLGLLPIDAVMGCFGVKTHIGGTATGNIWVTSALAVCTLILIVSNGLRIGGKAYLAHFCPGPLWLAPLMVLVEIVGLFAKICALAIRLFANMMAGHILLAVLLGFTTALPLSSLGGIGIAIPSMLAAVAITCLELFVAFLQAFIFAFLTTVFLGQSIVLHHEH